ESGWVSASCRWLSERPSPGIAPCVAWCFFFQAEDGIRDGHVTGVQTCALPIYDAHSRLRQRIAVRGSARDQRDVITGFAYDGMRSEERRVGKECRCRWWADYSKKKSYSHND